VFDGSEVVARVVVKAVSRHSDLSLPVWCSSAVCRRRGDVRSRIARTRASRSGRSWLAPVPLARELICESASDTPTVFDALMHGIGAYFVARGIWMVASLRGQTSPKAEIVVARTHKECPHCKEQMRRDATVCPHCQRESQAWVQNDGFWWRRGEDDTWLFLTRCLPPRARACGFRSRAYALIRPATIRAC
jgi:hypothetical protein